MIKQIIFAALLTVKYATAQEQSAIVLIKGTNGTEPSGVVKFVQTGPSHPVRITGQIKGLTPGLHGFHIHTLGDITNGCGPTGPHYNPYKKTHGAPDSDNRHAGDFGNIKADESGVAHIDFVDRHIDLCGPISIIGRAVVVHAGVDDLGLGDNADSKISGNAGGRIACGVVGYLSAVSCPASSVQNGVGVFTLSSSLMGAAFLLQFLARH